jgi:amino acid adenylation domain-containing protein
VTSQLDTILPAAVTTATAADGAESALLLPELFAAQARRTPQAVAVEDAAGQLTYRQLDLMSSRLANLLREYDIRGESLVGVCMRRSTNLVIGLLGLWKAGAAYVPLDPDHPADRLGWLVGDTRAKVVLTEESLAEKLSFGGAYLMPLDGLADRLLRYPVTPPRSELEPDSVAYAVYTSGATGQPKGVLVSHGGIANRVRWSVREHGLGPDDRVLQKTMLTFDAAAWEVFAPLISGGTVVLAPQGAESDPESLVRAVGERDVTVLQVVPSVLRLLVEAPGWERCERLRLVFSAGEPLHAELAQRLATRTGATLWNTYGPTECSIDVTAHRFDPQVSAGPVPIGRPIENTRALILSTDGVPVPRGVPGELHIGGAGLARGYLARPELTAQRFVPDPYGPPGSRLYRTGDLVRWRSDDTLEYLGRLDHQVKVNGVRIEPGEIEAALAGHPAVRGAVVLPFTAPDGSRRLAAYIQSRRELQPQEWRAFLATRLPAPYLPAVYIPVAEFPLTSSGKVDRAALLPATGAPATTGDITVQQG